MVGIKDTFTVGDKIIRWESVIKWMLDWAQKQPHEKKEARDSFVKSKKIFKDIKIGARKQNKELYAKLYHVASNCGLEEECAFYKKSGKVLATRIQTAKEEGRIGAYINKYYQEDSDEWKNAYAVFDSEATAQKEKLKKSRGTDEVVKSLVHVKPGKNITSQEYDKSYREAKKCLERTCDACKEKGTALEICMESPSTPGENVHPQCVERTCELGQYCKVIPGGQGTKSDVCVPSLTSPGEYRHRLCSEAKSFDPTNSNVGCAVCGGKYYLSSTSSEVMKYEAEANGLIGFIDNYETITKGKAHMDCWRVIRNDAAKKKEKREKEVLRDRYRNMTAEQWDAERKALIEKAAKIWAK